MPDFIQTEEFDASMLPLLRSFRFWEGESGRTFERELGDWLLSEIESAVATGTRVWLYRNSAGDAIGYGSLGTDTWERPDGKRTLMIIPAVAIRYEYQGKPSNLTDRRLKDSHQILFDLIAKAYRLTEDAHLPPLLGLLTHPDNTKAVNLYRQYGFEPFDYVFVDPETGIRYPSHIRKLN